MYASTSPSETAQKQRPHSRHQRVDAAAAVSFKHDGIRTKLDQLYQQGSAKIRFPKHYDDQLEAVLINTAGGLTGGDNVSWDVNLGQHCNAVLTTQACEKSYRSTSGTAHVQTSLRLKAGSILHWVPQETILYDGSSLTRSFNVEMEGSSELLALETVMLGREAMGEQIETLAFLDRWRIKLGGRMTFADDLRLDGCENSLAKFGNKRAVASLLFVSPKDEEALRSIASELRQICKNTVSGFSVFNGKITGRILASNTYELRHVLAPVLRILRGAELPRVWRT